MGDINELRWIVNGFLEWHEGGPCPDGLIERARAAVPPGVGDTEQQSELLEAVDAMLETAPCECSHKQRYEIGGHKSFCFLFDLDIARTKMLSIPSPQGEKDGGGVDGDGVPVGGEAQPSDMDYGNNMDITVECPESGKHCKWIDGECQTCGAAGVTACDAPQQKGGA